MKTTTYATKEDWFAGRLGKITGSRLKDIVVKRGTGKKKGYYELIAERISLPSDGENPMDRGTRLESEAIEKFIAMTGHNVCTDLVIWSRDDNESIAISPDGFIGETMAVEAKCLSSASQVEAYLTNKIPDEYEMQMLQYFIVNDKLQTLYFCFYDPRIIVEKVAFFFLTVRREDVEDDINTYLAYQRDTLLEIEQIVTNLSF